MIKKELKDISKDPSELVYRVLSWVLTSIFLANFPLLLFLIYMLEHSFFSYDFFTDGVFGLKAFFFLTGVGIFLISIASFGCFSVLIYIKKRGKFKGWIIVLIAVSLFNLLFLALLGITPLIFKLEYSLLLYLSVIGIFITIHATYIYVAKPSEQLKSLLVTIVMLTLTSSVFYQNHSAYVLSKGLQAFGMGGEIQVVLTPKLDGKTIPSGKLLLMSPEHIYIKLKDKLGVSIFKRSRFDVITIRNSVKVKEQSK